MEKPIIDSKDALVAYMDILGYSNILKNATPEIYYNAINDALAEWSKHFTEDVKNKYVLSRKINENLFFQVFSDSFIIAVDEEKLLADKELKRQNDTITHIFSYLVAFLVKDIFLKTKHLLRGAIGRGSFYANKFAADKSNIFVFSRTLSDIYELAEKRTETPKIVIHTSVIEKLDEKRISSNQSIAAYIKDVDNSYYVNIYSAIIGGPRTDIEAFIAAKGIIEQALNNLKARPKDYKKWHWFAEYHNLIINRIINESGNIHLHPDYKQFEERKREVLVKL